MLQGRSLGLVGLQGREEGDDVVGEVRDLVLEVIAVDHRVGLDPAPVDVKHGSVQMVVPALPDGRRERLACTEHLSAERPSFALAGELVEASLVLERRVLRHHDQVDR